MAKQNPDIRVVDRTVKNIVSDEQGQVLLNMQMRDTTEFDQDTVHRSRLNESRVLIDGTVYNPAMSLGDKPKVLLGMSAVCRQGKRSWLMRRPPSSGLCNMETGSRCVRCGQFLCPGHAKYCSDDQTRCKRCKRRWLIKRFFRWLFFKTEE